MYWEMTRKGKKTVEIFVGKKKLGKHKTKNIKEQREAQGGIKTISTNSSFIHVHIGKAVLPHTTQY